MPPPNSTPVWWGLGGPGGLKLVPIEMSSPYSCATSRQTKGVSCTCLPQNTTQYTYDRAIGIGRLMPNKKSPQIVELRPPMCWTHFSRQTLTRIHWIFWWICNYYDFTTPINSKCCSTCYLLAVICMGSFCGSQFWRFGELGESWRVVNCANRKPTHDFLILLNA